MQISLWKRDHDFIFTKQPINIQSDVRFDSLHLRHCSRFDPKVDLEHQRVVTEVIEPNHRFGTFLNIVCVRGRLFQQGDDSFKRRSVRDTNRNRCSQAVVPTRQVGDVVLKKLAVGNNDVEVFAGSYLSSDFLSGNTESRLFASSHRMHR